MKSTCKVSSESAKLGFQETVEVEAQVPKAGHWDVVTNNNSEGLENLCMMSPSPAMRMMSSAPVMRMTGGITCYITCNVHTAFTLKVCNETFYHRVKLITHIKTEHGVNIGKKYM